MWFAYARLRPFTGDCHITGDYTLLGQLST